MATVINVTTKVMATSKTKVTCGFKEYKNHKGADLIPKSTSETPNILAYDEGTVIFTGNVSGEATSGNAAMGTCVAIKHPDGKLTRYQHMKYNSLKVKKGDKVKKGQVLGLYGRPTTGNSSGCHLHFDISLPSKPSVDYVKGSFCNETRYYVNPIPYLTKKASSGSTDTAASEGNKYKVTATKLNVRKGPGTGYSVAKTLKSGTIVTVYEIKNGFGKVSQNNSEWVSMDYLKKQ